MQIEFYSDALKSLSRIMTPEPTRGPIQDMPIPSTFLPLSSADSSIPDTIPHILLRKVFLVSSNSFIIFL